MAAWLNPYLARKVYFWISFKDTIHWGSAVLKAFTNILSIREQEAGSWLEQEKEDNEKKWKGGCIDVKC